MCGGVSSWLDQRSATATQVQATLGDLAAGKVPAKVAKKRLAEAYAKGTVSECRVVELGQGGRDTEGHQREDSGIPVRRDAVGLCECVQTAATT